MRGALPAQPKLDTAPRGCKRFPRTGLSLGRADPPQGAWAAPFVPAAEAAGTIQADHQQSHHPPTRPRAPLAAPGRMPYPLSVQAVSETVATTWLAGMPGWGIVLILLLALIVLAAGDWSQLARGFRKGLSQFRKASKHVTGLFDDPASQAGRSAGGIYGKAALQAVTPDNQVAERYHPDPEKPPGLRLLLRLHSWLRRILQIVCGAGPKK